MGVPVLGMLFSRIFHYHQKQDFKTLRVYTCEENPQENLLFKAQESLHGNVMLFKHFPSLEKETA